MERPAPPTIFSARRKAARAQRANATGRRPGAATWLADALVDDLAERIDFLRLPPGRALVMGTGGEELGALIEDKGFAVTFSEQAPLDLEQPYPFGDFDLIASLAILDTVNDLPGALIHQRRALARGGVVIASLIAAGSLPLLRSALLAADGARPAARLHPAIDAKSGAGLLQRAGFTRQVADSWPLRLRYSALDTLVEDLRAQGLTSALADRAPPLTRAGLERARDAFLQDADDDGKVVETLEIVTLTGWHGD